MQAQTRQVTVPGGGTLPFSLGVKADGLIYVAGTLAQQGDIKAQTKSVLDAIGQTLTKSGSSLANVVAAHVYLKNGADAAAMTEVWRTVWPKDAPTRTTVQAQLVSPTALVEIAVVAVPNGAERVVILPAGWSTANPYSYAIRTGDTLFMSGVVARDPKTNTPVEGDAATQTKAVMATAGELLKAAGFGFEHVVASRVYITDNADFQAMNQNYTPSFPKDPPARATVVTPLPGPTYKVEMTFTANRGAKQAFTTPAADGTPGQAERDPEQRDQGGQPPLRLGHPRQHAREQGRHDGTDHGTAGPRRTDDEGGRLRLGRCRRWHRLHHRHLEVQRHEHRLPHDLHQGLPHSRHGRHRAGGRRRPGRDHVRRVEVSRAGHSTDSSWPGRSLLRPALC